MDLYFPYLLPLAVLVASFVSVFCLNSLKSSTNVTLPPGKRGLLASIREAWQFYQHCVHGCPEKFVFDRMSKHSPDVFTTSLLGTKVAVFCGASGNKFMCSSGSKFFDRWLPSSMPKLFPEISRNTTRSLSNKFVKSEYLQRYIPLMDSMAKEHLKSDWLPHKVVNAAPLSNKFTLSVACRLFFSIKDPEVIKRLEHPFHLISVGFISMPINLPGTAFNRAVRGVKIIRKELIPVIKQRRQESTAREDALDRILEAADENGRNMSEKVIADTMMGLLIASHDSTSSAITFVVKCLAENPHICKKVFEEQMEIANSKSPGELLDLDDVNRMKYSWSVARESLRTAPLGITFVSETKMEIPYAGFTIPKGMKIISSACSTHMNPEYFANPEKFDPSRFEGKGPAPFTFIPFAAGSRICPGREYARVIILVFMHNFVTRFNFEKVNPQKILYQPFPLPKQKDGLPILLYPKEVEI